MPVLGLRSGYYCRTYEKAAAVSRGGGDLGLRSGFRERKKSPGRARDHPVMEIVPDGCCSLRRCCVKLGLTVL
jgi:hypothetical protein